MSFSFRDKNDYELLKKYYNYCALRDGLFYSRSEFIVRILMNTLRRDKDFMDFAKSNGFTN